MRPTSSRRVRVSGHHQTTSRTAYQHSKNTGLPAGDYLSRTDLRAIVLRGMAVSAQIAEHCRKVQRWTCRQCFRRNNFRSTSDEVLGVVTRPSLSPGIYLTIWSRSATTDEITIGWYKWLPSVAEAPSGRKPEGSQTPNSRQRRNDG